MNITSESTNVQTFQNTAWSLRHFGPLNWKTNNFAGSLPQVQSQMLALTEKNRYTQRIPPDWRLFLQF